MSALSIGELYHAWHCKTSKWRLFLQLLIVTSVFVALYIVTAMCIVSIHVIELFINE